ncbi:MAG: YopX family protein, partial [Clostridiales bacterium]|nr:YopX family protein [Clostridiales bacterium]
VGQYTGLTDKNGVKIFEGDILEAESGNIGYVMFINGAFMKSCNSKDMPFLIASDVNAVIGNVFDNPELLKGEDLK